MALSHTVPHIQWIRTSNLTYIVDPLYSYIFCYNKYPFVTGICTVVRTKNDSDIILCLCCQVKY